MADTDSSIPFSTATPVSPTSPISLVRLLVTPGLYQGRAVSVVGFVRLQFEGDAIYLHREDCSFGIYANSLWLSLNDRIRRQATRCAGRYCLVQGVFNQHNNGHFSLWPGGIDEVSHIRIWDEDEASKLRQARHQRRFGRRLKRQGRVCCFHCGAADRRGNSSGTVATSPSAGKEGIRLVESPVHGAYFICAACGRSFTPFQGEQAYLWLHSERADVWRQARGLLPSDDRHA